MTGGITGYWLGRTPTIACQADPRFSYCLYVSPTYAQRTEPATLVVVLHDTLRNHQALRDAFAEYAERANAIVLAPLFPAGIGAPDDLDHYKLIVSAAIYCRALTSPNWVLNASVECAGVGECGLIMPPKKIKFSA